MCIKHITKKVSIVISGLIIILSFQNCGSDFNADEYVKTDLSSESVPLPEVVPGPVSQAPTITSTSTPGTVAAGAAATLSVSATGAQLQFQWYKNNVLLPGATSSLYAIPSASAADAASYYVIVSNPHGQVQSQSVSLQVSSPPPAPAAPQIVSITPKQVLPLLSNQPVQLSVNATGTDLTYSWQRFAFDANNVLQTYPVPGATAQVQTTLSSFTYEGQTIYYVDIGTYRVTVRDSLGRIVTADVVVEWAPIVF